MADADSSKPMTKIFFGTLVFFAAYIVATLLCLRQWGTPHPWSRLDVFSGGFLLLSALWAVAQTRFHQTIFRSREVMREASGASYDPGMLKGITAISIAELSVFLDYGRWHLLPALEKPALQSLGLVLCLLGAIWLLWVDGELSRHFSANPGVRQVMRDGPYRFVRHPRYVALLISRISFSLALASPLAWLSTLGWLWLILRRIRFEEAHLHELFGAEYDAYAAATARLIPGVY